MVDRYEENAASFIEQNDFKFRFYTDTLAKVLNQELIPAIPQKVFFIDGELKVMNRIGDKKSYTEILNFIN